MTPEEQQYLDLCYRIHTDLATFVKRSFPGYSMGKPHKIIIEELTKFLQKVRAKQRPRLAISIYPRAGKSMLVSERFPAWALGNYPDLHFIGASYAAPLANEFSRHIKEIMLQDWYQDAFPDTRLKKDSRDVGRWETTANGGYRSAGAGVGVTGFGADILCIDDVFKDAAQAFSLNYRNKIWDWFRSTAHTRLSEGGGVIYVGTRWHKDDLIGRILEQSTEEWTVLKFKAIDDNGEVLHPERFSLETMESIRATVGDYFWSAMYQQEPVDDHNLPFKRHLIRGITSERYEDHIIKATLDLAYTTHDSSDYTGLAIGGIDAAGTRRTFYAEERKVSPSDRYAWLLPVLHEWYKRGLRELHVEGNEDAIFRTEEAIRDDKLRIQVFPLKHKNVSKTERILESAGYLPTAEFHEEHANALINRMCMWSPASGTPDDLIDAWAYLMRVLDSKPASSSKIDLEKQLDPVRKGILKAMRKKHEDG